MNADLQQRILDAVDQRFDEQVEFLAELVSHASTRGNEQSAQRFIAEQFADRGYDTDEWHIDVADIAHLPGFSPVLGDYEDAINVVGTWHGGSGKGRSLILNGHIDVVPAGPTDMWATPPFEPSIADGWMTGRGAGDMKAGDVANVFALDAIRDAGGRPAGDVYLQSVVEEECTGNGALACLQRGYRADAAIIPEPFHEHLISAQVGVIWLQVNLRGIPVHVLEAGSGVNAIEAAIPLIAALRELETRWNEADKHPAYEQVEHPLNLNIGRIAGGDWTSSVPAWCQFDVRMAVYPGQDLSEARAELEACIQDAARSHDFLSQNPPEIVYHGFMGEGYALDSHDSPVAREAISTLASAHETVTGDVLRKTPVTAATDARFFGLYAGIPALVYGPVAEAIHGFNERVDLESMRRVTKSIALFVAAWCGVEQT